MGNKSNSKCAIRLKKLTESLSSYLGSVKLEDRDLAVYANFLDGSKALRSNEINFKTDVLCNNQVQVTL